MELVYTEEGTFIFWALEATDLVERKLLLYFFSINWEQDKLFWNLRTLALLPLCLNSFPFHQGSEPQLEETISEQIENYTRGNTQNKGRNKLVLYDFQIPKTKRKKKL